MTKFDFFVFLTLAFVLMMIVNSIAAHFEKKAFNGGYCPKCGKKLIFYDTDSQGGRAYRCHDWHYNCWVSYNRVDRNFNKRR